MPQPQATRRTSTEILESSRLEVLVPHASDIDIPEIIKSQSTAEGCSSDPSVIEAVSGISQRRSLFYGETEGTHILHSR